ncbi:hypothetical protein Acsp03_60310 [Actinomadura sp. NBRC 104412]|uniref:VMAP-C domain-containing protein n=1 Tax=Actinomadura sp. NBRC 104412 TaxID=3032203 RepID=UPI0024A542E0|nr:hypothetical protein [Actinomadura sp. NBRC 104412]GLZ08565.1 hypothetical protein Acsp03_60310 [Actinomadura sp. NBRC 104412]
MTAGTLGPGERRRLIDALLRIDALSVRSTREACVTELQNTLSRPLEWERDERALHDVWGLAVACLGRPGGIQTLLDVVEFFDRGSHAFREARALADAVLPEPLLTTEERRLLAQLVQHLERQGLTLIQHAELVPAYQRAVGEFGPPPRPEVYDERHIVDVRLLIEQLEEAPLGPDGVAPLLRFVHELAGYAKAPVATAFAEWMARFAERTGLGQDWRRLLTATEERPALDNAERAASLVFECRPDGADPDRLAVSARLERADGTVAMVRCDEEPEPVERLPALVEALLNRERGLLAAEHCELTIAFALPRDLLDLPCDQFVVTLGGVPRRLGIEYPVVLRSLDRMDEVWLWPKWRSKWNLLREGAGEARVHPVSEPGEYDGERLFAVLSDPEAVGLAMAYPPMDEGPGRVDEIWVAFETGAPIVVWCRKSRVPERFTEEARELCGSDPATLPRTVRRLRREAVLSQDRRQNRRPQTLPGGGALEDANDMDETEHLGMHLALLYDDADRVPEPYDRLRPPA